MRRLCGLAALALLTGLGCRRFDAGLTGRDDAAVWRRPADARDDARQDAPRTEDVAVERPPDEPGLPGDPAERGCADGTREGFVSSDWKNIAGCAGSWQVRGLGDEARVPRCGLLGGNDSVPLPETECSVADLCAAGWHVCADATEVARQSPTGCEGAVSSEEPRFFLVLAAASEQGVCSPDRLAKNDLHGCGTLGQPESAACQPLDHRMTFADCAATGVWACGGAGDHLQEAALVTKSDGRFGGVLCCRDN